MKNIVLIGAGKGIGAATLNKLSGNNQHITALSRSDFEQSSYSNIHLHKFDVLKDDFSQISFPDEIHGLVYFPGSIQLKPFNKLKQEDFENDFEINVLGAVKTIQYFLPHLNKANKSSIVLFSTVAAKLGMPFHASIATSKSAVEGLVKSFAAEYAASQIRCNAIAPSLTQTALSQHLLSNEAKISAAAERHPMKKIGQATDIANLVTFLLSDESEWMTGQIIGIDGGIGALKV